MNRNQVLGIVLLTTVMMGIAHISYYHPQLPEKVAIHFNVQGEADGFASRNVHTALMIGLQTGLAAFLMGFQNWEGVMRHPVVGALWETYAITQVVKHYHSRGKIVPLWFWRTVHGAEVDLLIEQGGAKLLDESNQKIDPLG